MFRHHRRAAFILSAGLLFAGVIPSANPAFAGVLNTHHNEWAFDLSYSDVKAVDTSEAVGKTTSVDGQWQWIFGKGYTELGLLVSYFKIETDDFFFGPSTQDGWIAGPSFTWNWMPKSPITGYLSAAAGGVGGDLGNVYDSAAQGTFGAKIFVGNSAAVRIEYVYQRLYGASFYSDSETRTIHIGVSIFSGHK